MRLSFLFFALCLTLSPSHDHTVCAITEFNIWGVEACFEELLRNWNKKNGLMVHTCRGSCGLFYSRKLFHFWAHDINSEKGVNAAKNLKKNQRKCHDITDRILILHEKIFHKHFNDDYIEVWESKWVKKINR